VTLTKPSRKLKKQIMKEVGFAERLTGYKLHERMGPMPRTLYSFREILDLLNEANPRIDFNGLEQWIREVMGDGELAERILETVEVDRSDQEKTCLIRDLLAQRLAQCR